ncbi:MAG: hypothetical protein QM627_05990 [Luteolibacter sp.]
MTQNILLTLITFALTGCDHSTRSPALPDNVQEGRPIVIKEGQAVILVPEGNKSVMIGASVVNGKLSISEVDPKGRSFSITWNSADSWETSVMNSTEEGTTVTIDKDGDGLPDLRTILKEGSASRYQLKEPNWIELQSTH